jgi:predicted DNA-binding protein with PD1-like motif
MKTKMSINENQVKQESFVAAEGKTGRMIAIRLNRGTDLVQGVVDACKKYGIRSGAVTAMIGSLAGGAQLRYIALDPSAKTGAGFTDFQTIEHPTELLSGQGIICDNGDDLYIHLHAVLIDINGKIHGGHIQRDYKCYALNTLEVVVQEMTGAIFGRALAEDTGYTVSMPKQL